VTALAGYADSSAGESGGGRLEPRDLIKRR